MLAKSELYTIRNEIENSRSKDNTICGQEKMGKN